MQWRRYRGVRGGYYTPPVTYYNAEVEYWKKMNQFL